MEIFIGTPISRVLRSKYCSDKCDIDMFKDKVDASNAWKGILKNVDTLKKGISMAVGDGRKTLFWQRRCATDEPLITLAGPTPPLEIQDDTVDEMWDTNSGWKYDIFADFLPASVLSIIASHELTEDDNVVDEVF